MKQNLAMIDLNTGEILPGVPVYRPAKTKLRGWFMVWEQGLKRLAQDEDLTGETLRVLMYCLSELDYENYLKVTQKDIVEALEMKRQNVSRAIKMLVDKQILIQGPKSGRSNTYRLNEFYGWKGKLKNMGKETR